MEQYVILKSVLMFIALIGAFDERAKQVVTSGAAIVASACPFCATMLNDGIMETDQQIPIKDIAEILDEVTS